MGSTRASRNMKNRGTDFRHVFSGHPKLPGGDYFSQTSGAPSFGQLTSGLLIVPVFIINDNEDLSPLVGKRPCLPTNRGISRNFCTVIVVII